MATFTGPKCRLCRREGEKLFLKGDRCHTQKCAITAKNYAPGVHGANARRKTSEFGKQLREKQKAKRTYGVFERQFAKYYKEAERQEGVTGDNLLRMLESRLDNVVYRLGIAPSRRAARQIVGHGLIEINGKKATIPSMMVSEGDEVAVRDAKKAKKLFEHIEERQKNLSTPAWLHIDTATKQGKVLHEPQREEIDTNIEVKLIIEHYSR